MINTKTNRANFNLFKPLTDTSTKKTANGQDILIPIKSLQPNYFGIFNIIGNVAEMVAEKNICKGGSWQHQKEEARPGKNIEYNKPEAWIGFRCVCEYTSNSSK